MNRKELLKITKIGMAVSLGMLAFTGMRPRHRGCRGAGLIGHTWWGIAMTGFAVWHYNIHTKRRRELWIKPKKITHK